jgi:hypothetical protein
VLASPRAHPHLEAAYRRRLGGGATVDPPDALECPTGAAFAVAERGGTVEACPYGRPTGPAGYALEQAEIAARYAAAAWKRHREGMDLLREAALDPDAARAKANRRKAGQLFLKATREDPSLVEAYAGYLQVAAEGKLKPARLGRSSPTTGSGSPTRASRLAACGRRHPRPRDRGALPSPADDDRRGRADHSLNAGRPTPRRSRRRTAREGLLKRRPVAPRAFLRRRGWGRGALLRPLGVTVGARMTRRDPARLGGRSRSRRDDARGSAPMQRPAFIFRI